jgi:ABC-type histidine transport system ATPase subunit
VSFSNSDPHSTMTPVIAVLAGGISAERDVSLGSGRAAAIALAHPRTGAVVRDLLFDLNRASGTTMVLVTHDLDFAARCDRVLHLHEGRLREDTTAHRKQSDAVPAEPGLA